jgi:LysM repeat protein
LRAGRVGLGAAVQNFTGNMKYEGISYRFPTNYGAGISVDLPEQGLRFALDANVPAAYYPDVRTGVEWRWKDQFALRTGYRAELGAEEGEPLGGPTFGMGAGVGGFWFDYGYVISGIAEGGQHQLGITVRPQAFMGGAFGASSGASSPAEPILPERDEAPAKPKAEKPAPVKETKPEPKAAPKPTVVKTAPAPVATPAPKKQAEPVKVEPETGEAKPAAAKPAVTPAAPKKVPNTHRVQAGETLISIAKHYGTTVPKIMDLNNMVNATIHVGQVIKLPKK